VSHYQAKRIDRLNGQLADERAARQDQLRQMATNHSMIVALAETKRTDAVAVAEKERVNALLAAAAANVVLANARQELTASALAERVDTSAKTLALQVEATKTAAQIAVDATTLALGARIKPLEDARYEQAGRHGGQSDITGIVKYIIGILIGLAAPVILLLSGHVK
jgi:hypothetical protein